jgi:hypothetical protein
MVGGYGRFGGTYCLHLAEKIEAFGKYVLNCTASHLKNTPLCIAV